jgi:hypothetical protein
MKENMTSRNRTKIMPRKFGLAVCPFPQTLSLNSLISESSLEIQQFKLLLKVPGLIPVEAPTVALYREGVRDVLPRKINLCFMNLGDHASLTTSHHDGTS